MLCKIPIRVRSLGTFLMRAQGLEQGIWSIRGAIVGGKSDLLRLVWDSLAPWVEVAAPWVREMLHVTET